jgi:hypothetical protein
VSRLIWVFAKDNGLPFSNFFSYVSPQSDECCKQFNLTALRRYTQPSSYPSMPSSS